jgi:hypothetical protein
MIIDFHTHAFADALAGRALAKLAGNSGLQPALDGTVGSLRASMRRAGIARAVLCPIATRPHHFDGIRDWARELRTSAPELETLVSVHPDDPAAARHLEEAAAEGFKGVKFHPYYQDFAVDEPRMYPIYEKIRDLGLLAVFHCGFDIAFPHTPLCNPAKIRRLADDLPGFKLVATHFGGWMDWDEAERHVIGRPIWLDTSMTSPSLPPERLRRMALSHPAEYLLFGTDSPWTDESAEIALWRSLDLPPDRLDAFLGGNASRLLASVGFPPA